MGEPFVKRAWEDWPGGLLVRPPGWSGLYCWLSSSGAVFVSLRGRGSSWSARSVSAREGAGEDERA